MRKKIETFDDYMADDERVSFEEKEQILFEAALIKKETNQEPQKTAPKREK